MSYWNYRVVRKDSESGSSFEIYEVYYNDDNHIESWTVEAMAPFGETLTKLKDDLAYMAQALKRPLLKEIVDEDGKEKRVEVTPA